MKIRFLFAFIGLAISFAVPVLAQEQNTVDPEVRQQIEAALKEFDQECNKQDTAAIAALFTQDAVEMWFGQPEGSASGQQAIAKRYTAELAGGVPHYVSKLLQVFAIANDICAIMEWSLPPVDTKGHYSVRIYAHDADTWKIRMAYLN
jgi:ketosteroid isomerase-like protein